MKSILSAALGLVLGLATSASMAASTGCPEHFADGHAPDLMNLKLASKAREVCFSEFAVLHSGLTRTALYSADHLTDHRVILAKQQHRTDAAETFHEEERLPEDERSWLRDFARSGYDRGHLTPNADFDNPVAQGESFSLANMIPQVPENNRGIWADIESTTRAVASQYGEAWVVTVPIFAGAETRWLHDRVAIPAKIAKAIYIPAIKGTAAYLVDNAPGYEWRAISIVQLRDMSGIDVFPGLPEEIKKTPIQLPTPQHKSRKGRN